MHATQEEWNKVVSAAYRRHMMAPVGAKAWYEGSGRITFECCEELKFLPTCVMPWPKRSSGTSGRSPRSFPGSSPIAPWSGS